MILVVMMVLAVLGAGLTFLGYNESLQLLTVTNTQPFTTTSTRTLSSVSTETRVMTTSGSESIVDTTIDLMGEGTTGRHCYWGYSRVYVDAGQVHVSYDSPDGVVDFWILDEKGFTAYDAKIYCEELREVAGIVHKFGLRNYETTVTIPSSGTYYVMFLNSNKQDVSVSVRMDTIAQQTVVTKTVKSTYYSTEQSPVVTERVSVNTERVPLGVMFYGGIGLLVIAVVVLVSSMMRRKPEPGTTPSPPESAPAQAPEGKFCVECGAPLSARASFCKKCGTKQ